MSEAYGFRDIGDEGFQQALRGQSWFYVHAFPGGTYYDPGVTVDSDPTDLAAAYLSRDIRTINHRWLAARDENPGSDIRIIVERRPDEWAALEAREALAGKVADRLLSLKANDEAKRLYALEQSAFGSFDPSAVIDILDMPAKSDEDAWLIQDVLTCGAVGVLYGASYTGKTFLALDWAASIATGTDWHSRPVKQARVLYVMIEAPALTPPKLAAWMQDRGVQLSRGQFDLYPRTVSVADHGSVRALAEFVKAGGYGLVVLDTLAHVMLGLDEKDSRDMGTLVAALVELREAGADAGASIVGVHHTLKGDDTMYRGNNALFGGVDWMWNFIADDIRKPGRRLEFAKDKTGTLPEPLHMRFVSHAVPNWSKPQGVLVRADAPTGNPVTDAYELLAGVAIDGVVTRAMLEAQVTLAGYSDATAREYVTRALHNGIIVPLNPGSRVRGADIVTLPHATTTAA